MAHGGKRVGSGRKPGVTSRPSILEYWTKEDIEDYFDHVKKNYKKDARLCVWAGDHLLGKAPQAITGPNGEALTIHFANVFSNTSRETE
jgi:hypothetical protein